MITPLIWMVTGPRQAGKTAFCQGMAEAARQADWQVTGLLSPAQIEQGVKTGIRVENIQTGDTRQLASITRQSQEDLVFGHWYFNQQVLTWGNHVLENNPPCDLLILDELGPLELTRQVGWQAALNVIRRGEYRLALVVIRPELQDLARSLFDFSEIIEIEQNQPTDHWVHIYLPKMMGQDSNL
jgi:nucleoside-triphosphatase THEP1